MFARCIDSTKRRCLAQTHWTETSRVEDVGQERSFSTRGGFGDSQFNVKCIVNTYVT